MSKIKIVSTGLRGRDTKIMIGEEEIQDIAYRVVFDMNACEVNNVEIHLRGRNVEIEAEALLAICRRNGVKMFQEPVPEGEGR